MNNIIDIKDTRNTEVVIVNNNILDKHRDYQKTVKLFGIIKLWGHKYDHTFTYEKRGEDYLRSKPGFKIPQNNEETNKTEK